MRARSCLAANPVPFNAAIGGVGRECATCWRRPTSSTDFFRAEDAAQPPESPGVRAPSHPILLRIHAMRLALRHAPTVTLTACSISPRQTEAVTRLHSPVGTKLSLANKRAPTHDRRCVLHGTRPLGRVMPRHARMMLTSHYHDAVPAQLGRDDGAAARV